jgi:hypothetical protein
VLDNGSRNGPAYSGVIPGCMHACNILDHSFILPIMRWWHLTATRLTQITNLAAPAAAQRFARRKGSLQSMHTSRRCVFLFTLSMSPIATPGSPANFNLQHMPRCFFVHLQEMPKKYS